MLELFKGQLTLHDIMYGLTLKQATSLKETRYKRLMEERKSADEMLQRK